MMLLLSLVSLIFAEQVTITQYDSKSRETLYLTTLDGSYARLVTAKELADNPKLTSVFAVGGMSGTTITHEGTGICKKQDPYSKPIISCPLGGDAAQLTWDIVEKGAGLFMIRASDGTCITNIDVPYNNVPGLCMHARPCSENDPKQLFEVRADAAGSPPWNLWAAYPP